MGYVIHMGAIRAQHVSNGIRRRFENVYLNIFLVCSIQIDDDLLLNTSLSYRHLRTMTGGVDSR